VVLACWLWSGKAAVDLVVAVASSVMDKGMTFGAKSNQVLFGIVP
jgi:hypothetical protein